MVRVVRWKSRVFVLCSSRAMALATAERVNLSLTAAAEKLPSSAAAIKILKTFRSVIVKKTPHYC
jgi:hypothetical protein